jgi:hypothetical protein
MVVAARTLHKDSFVMGLYAKFLARHVTVWH